MKYILNNRAYIFMVSVLDLIGGILFLPFTLLKKRSPGEVKNILLIRMDHIGDVACATPAAENLKNRYPGAKITFLTASWAKEIVINNPYIDEVICYDAPWFNRGNRKLFAVKSFLRLAKELKKYKYDLGFDLRGDLRHILLMFLGGVKFRVGYGITGGAFLLHKEAAYNYGAHAVEHNLNLLRALDIDIVSHRPKVYASKEDEDFAEDFLRSHNLGADDFIALIHTSAGYASKNWLDDRFVELLGMLKEAYNAKLVLIGSEKDREKNEKIISRSSLPAINAAGKTSVSNLISLMDKASVFIGVDSGPSHIAALKNRPAVVLYSGTNSPSEWAPISDKTIIIQKEIPCKNCEKTDCEQNICMDLITPDDVLKAVRKVLQQ